MPLKQLWSWEADVKKEDWDSLSLRAGIMTSPTYRFHDSYDGFPGCRHNEGELSSRKLP